MTTGEFKFRTREEDTAYQRGHNEEDGHAGVKARQSRSPNSDETTDKERVNRQELSPYGRRGLLRMVHEDDAEEKICHVGCSNNQYRVQNIGTRLTRNPDENASNIGVGAVSPVHPADKTLIAAIVENASV